MKVNQIYVNLPVADLKKSMEFFSKLGFEFNPDFTNEQGACMIMSENIFSMLLDKKFFKTFTHKEICDATKATEVLTCFSLDKRKDVDDLVARAKSLGASVTKEPQDHGFMYFHSFDDLDGHTWEIVSYEQK